MGDSGEISSSEAPRHEDVAHPKQGFDELPVDYGTMLILRLYEVHTMPSCCMILVLFLNKLDTILNTKTILFMYDYSTIHFIQCLYNFMMAVSVGGFTLVISLMYHVNTMLILCPYDCHSMLIPIYIQLQSVCH